MKKHILIFAVIGFIGFSFQSCQNVEQEVAKAKEEVKAEYETQIEALNLEWQTNLDLVSTSKDSLQFVLDSIYEASALAAAKKSTAKKVAPTPKPEPKTTSNTTSAEQKSSKISGTNIKLQESTEAKKKKISGGGGN